MTTLMLLPGLMCDAAVWTPMLPLLQAHAQCHVMAMVVSELRRP